jgi:hypothetical protein
MTRLYNAHLHLKGCPSGDNGQMGQTSVHQFTGDTPGKRQNVAPHFNQDMTPYSIFMLYFASVITLLAEETNRYYHQYLDTLDDGPSPLPDVNESEIFLFLAIIVQMGHDLRDSLTDFWSTIEQFLPPFYDTIKCDIFFHITYCSIPTPLKQ